MPSCRCDGTGRRTIGGDYLNQWGEPCNDAETVVCPGEPGWPCPFTRAYADGLDAAEQERRELFAHA